VGKALQAAVFVSLMAVAAPTAAQDGCVMGPADRAWLQGALANWRRSAKQELQLPDAPLPTIYAIDALCRYTLPAGDFAAMQSEPHGGTVALPNGEQAPLGPISFAFDRDQFVMSLPSVWRAAGVTSELGLEKLMDGVLLHEIMHTRQSRLAAALLDPIAAAHGLEETLSDDLLQETFQSDHAYAAAFREELDTLVAAAAAPDEAAAKGLAAHALHLMRARRARWLTGENAYFAELDDVFLTMEGMGQWLIYRHFLSPEGGSVPPDQALRAVRRDGRWWSQEEGLALLMVVDRLLPGWQQRAFRDPDWRAERLFAAAVER
jgi:hypothetical protein